MYVLSFNDVVPWSQYELIVVFVLNINGGFQGYYIFYVSEYIMSLTNSDNLMNKHISFLFIPNLNEISHNQMHTLQRSNMRKYHK